MSLELVGKAKAVYYEGLIAIGIGFMIILSFTVTDVSFFDDYVLEVLSWCYAENQDKFCQNFRESHNLSLTEQDAIGNKYWARLAGQAIEIFFIMFVVRMSFGVMLWKMGIRKIRITTVIMALIWGASAITLFMFGVLDTFYYILQGESIPAELGWLDKAGVFHYTKEWFGDPEHVDKEDLFATNIVGIAILIGLVVFNAFIFNYNGYRSRNIA